VTDHGDADADDDIEYVRGVRYGTVAGLVALGALVVGALVWWVREPGTPGDPSSVDTGFVLDMRVHHQQAVEMALLQLANGENAVVQSFAREVLLRQEFELGLMAAELDDWGIEPTTPETAMGWMDMPVPVEDMPGLASDEQMAALRAARGEDADALFLELMAEHHRGGIHMAEHAAASAATDDVRRLGASIVRLQRAEIEEYRATAAREGLDADV
jgi:uncharacterized protein (DUF305 family)